MTFLDVPSSLSVGSVNGIPIYQKIIPRYSDDARAGYSMKPKYITIHNTASSGKVLMLVLTLICSIMEIIERLLGIIL